jgi:polyisoprenoid-binding protein YceI
MSWIIDSAHSEVNFTVRHMMISNVRGRFEKLDGVVEFDDDNPALSNIDVRISVDSINTRESQRDAHLISPDFLDVEKYPHIVFRSKRIEMTGENRGYVAGDLTIKDVTREVVLDVDYAGTALSPYGSTSAGFTATARINRKEFGLTWNVALETGGVLVGEEIKIEIEVELIKEEEEVLEAAA